jgi:hypothetical protein
MWDCFALAVVCPQCEMLGVVCFSSITTSAEVRGGQSGVAAAAARASRQRELCTVCASKGALILAYLLPNANRSRRRGEASAIFCVISDLSCVAGGLMLG